MHVSLARIYSLNLKCVDDDGIHVHGGGGRVGITPPPIGEQFGHCMLIFGK